MSSIKRIIAEEGDGTPQRGRRPTRGPMAASIAPAMADDHDDEVLELSDPMPTPRTPSPEPQAQSMPQPVPQPIEPRQQRVVAPPSATVPVDVAKPERIVSPEAAAASRGALDMLSRLMVKPEPGSDGTVEGLIREMLRPMLRDWLDANLPELVETMVAREIKRITGSAG